MSGDVNEEIKALVTRLREFIDRPDVGLAITTSGELSEIDREILRIVSPPTPGIDGEIVAPVVWNVALTEEEIAAINAGTDPRTIRPEAQVRPQEQPARCAHCGTTEGDVSFPCSTSPNECEVCFTCAEAAGPCPTDTSDAAKMEKLRARLVTEAVAGVDALKNERDRLKSALADEVLARGLAHHNDGQIIKRIEAERDRLAARVREMEARVAWWVDHAGEAFPTNASKDRSELQRERDEARADNARLREGWGDSFKAGLAALQVHNEGLHTGPFLDCACARAALQTVTAQASAQEPQGAAGDGERRFYLLSVKWSEGDYLTWWRPDAKGYTRRLADAGEYTAEEARRYAHPLTIPVLCEKARALSVNVVPLNDDTRRWLRVGLRWDRMLESRWKRRRKQPATTPGEGD